MCETIYLSLSIYQTHGTGSKCVHPSRRPQGVSQTEPRLAVLTRETNTRARWTAATAWRELGDDFIFQNVVINIQNVVFPSSHHTLSLEVFSLYSLLRSGLLPSFPPPTTGNRHQINPRRACCSSTSGKLAGGQPASVFADRRTAAGAMPSQLRSHPSLSLASVGLGF